MPEETPVDLLYQDFQRLLAVVGREDVSLEVSLRITFSRSLFIASASYFEEQIERQVVDFMDSHDTGNELIKELVRQKAFGRQYHALFNWNAKNVNQFFALFGSAFSRSMRQYVDGNHDYQDAVSAFLEIGVARNAIAHKDYFHFAIDNKTTEEIYAIYKSALVFVNSIGSHLERVSNSNQAAI